MPEADRLATHLCAGDRCVTKATRLPASGVGALIRALVPTLLRSARKPGPLLAPMRHRYEAGPLDPMHVRAYRQFLGFADGSAPPLTYFYLLAQRAQLGLALDPGFSYPVAGVVHMDNELSMLAEVDRAAPFSIEATAEQDAAAPDDHQTVRFVMLINQEGTTRVRCASRVLVRKRKPAATASARTGKPRLEVEDLASAPVLASWPLPLDIGRRYAALSGDYNPIHLWPWSARLLGFKQPIAHGMYSAAKVQAALESGGRTIAGMSIRFLKPARLPTRAELRVDGYRYVLSHGEALTATGEFQVLP
jgi:hypothetical protein